MTVAAAVRCVMSLKASWRPPAMLTSSACGAAAYLSRAAAQGADGVRRAVEAEDRHGNRLEVRQVQPAVGHRLVERAAAEDGPGQPSAVGGAGGPGLQLRLPGGAVRGGFAVGVRALAGVRFGLSRDRRQPREDERAGPGEPPRRHEPGREQRAGVRPGEHDGLRAVEQAQDLLLGERRVLGRIGDGVHPVGVTGDPAAEPLVDARPLAPAGDDDDRAARAEPFRLGPAGDGVLVWLSHAGFLAEVTKFPAITVRIVGIYGGSSNGTPGPAKPWDAAAKLAT